MNKLYILAILGLILCPPQLSAKKDTADSLGIRKAVIQSPAEFLRGEVSGVRVSATDGGSNSINNVFIRGLNTIRGNSQPLWIIDDVVVGHSVGLSAPDYIGSSYLPSVNNMGWLNPYEIESVEVLKDLSATSEYGLLGANGVIIIKTRRAQSGDRNIHWSSSAGVDFLPKVGDAFRTGINHVHEIGVNGIMGSNSRYNISGFFRQRIGSVKDSGSSTGGLTFNFDTKANNVFHFGMNTFLACGETTSTSGVNYIGSPSNMAVSRYPDAFKHDSVAGWLQDYDDNILDYRTLNSVWLKINILPYLYFKISGGLDYQNQTRYLWFGDGTSFGAREDGIAAILNNSLMNYNAKGEFSFFRNIKVKHHLEANLSVTLNGYLNRTNSMEGKSFDLPYLRSHGLSASKSNNMIRKFSLTNSFLGASAHLNYDYDEIVGADARVHLDNNFRFDDKPVWFPGGNLWINLKRLALPADKVVTSLKLFGGYGMAGHETVMPYEWIGAYISDVPAIASGAERWNDGMNRLSSREWTAGASIGMLESRLGFSIKFFDKTTDDIFKVYDFGKLMDDLWIDAPHWNIKEQRISTIRNNGLELDLNAQLIRNRNFSWFMNCNATCHLLSEISLDDLDVAEQNITEGLYRHFDFDRTVPKYYGGLSTVLNFYGFTVDLRLSGAAGFDIINANKTLETWKNVITEDCFEKGDYLRLDHIAVSYEIPVKVKWIKSFKVNLAGHNLFTLTGYSGWNPDVNSFGSTVRSYGIDYGSYPLSRSLVLGLNVNF